MSEQDERHLKILNTWVWEAQWSAREWRAEAWRDCEGYDGGAGAWSQEDWNAAVEAGIDPITINRSFPAINKMLGSQVINRFELIAKARTLKDGEISQVMTEAIKFVMDQYQGEFLVSAAYADSLLPGFGCISPCLNADPRRERVAIRYRDWKEVWWDPFSPPWWSLERTRYVYWQPWVDLDDFQSLFSSKKQEIEDAYREMTGERRDSSHSLMMDEAQQREEKIRTLSASDWAEGERRRIRPVELWYPRNETCLFTLFPDGRCVEITPKTPPHQAYEMIKNSMQTTRAVVKKMRKATFFGEHLLLEDVPSPYAHDQFPLVPFVGYLDRWGFPYGMRRQIRGQDEEVDKRRSMALAMLKKRRVIAEEGVVEPSGNREKLDVLYEEANKLDGFMVVRPGMKDRFEIQDMAQFSPYQMELLRQSEFEIRDITGSDSPNFQSEQRQSGTAKQMDRFNSQMTTATLVDNLRRSLHMIGHQTLANIQAEWRYEKVLRVTDRLTGAERFVRVNQETDSGVRNDITQGKYDMVVTEVPITDTIREKNMEVLYEAIKMSPPEWIPTLLMTAFELSDLPNKEVLIQKLKPMMGMDPADEDLDPVQMKEKTLALLDANRAKAEEDEAINQELIKLKLNEARLKNLKIEAEIQKLLATAKEKEVASEIAEDEHEATMGREAIEGLARGVEIEKQLREINEGDTSGRGGIRGQGGENAGRSAGGPSGA